MKKQWSLWSLGKIHDPLRRLYLGLPRKNKTKTKNDKQCGKFHTILLCFPNANTWQWHTWPQAPGPSQQNISQTTTAQLFRIRLSCPSLFLAWISSIAIGQGHSCHIRKGGMKVAWRSGAAPGCRSSPPWETRKRRNGMLFGSVATVPPSSSKSFCTTLWRTLCEVGCPIVL